jgi:uncharacterized protein
MDLLRTILWLVMALMVVFLGVRRYKKGGFMTVVWLLVTMGVLIYAGLGLMLFTGQSRMLYLPWPDYDATPADAGMPFTPLTLSTPDGERLAAWYIPADGPAAWTVLYCHGNAGNISHRLFTLELIHELGANCLIFDYRGYGQSTGTPTEQGTITDVKTAWNWLVREQGVAPDEIILFGRSLGGSIAAIAAVDLNPAAVILESTFTSVVETGKHYYPWFPIRLFARYDYNTLAAVKKLNCPVFVAHSRDDEIIPYTFGEQLFEAANEPKLFRELKGTHNEGFFDQAAWYKGIWQDWLKELNQSRERP